MKRSIIPSIPSDPTPRFSDIVTVRGTGHLDKADGAATNLAFRNWLVTRGTTLGTIQDDPEKYAYYLGEYEEDRRTKVEFSDQGSIWQAVAWQWRNNRKQFVGWTVGIVLVVAVGLFICYGAR